MNVYECNGKNVVTDEMLGFGMNISSVTDEIILTIAQSLVRVHQSEDRDLCRCCLMLVMKSEAKSPCDKRR